MARRFSIAQLFLWLFVIVLGIELGAGLYETLVVMPLWSTAPPESIVAYHEHAVAYPQFALSAGTRFWMFNTPLVGLMAIATILSGLRTLAEHRKWRLAGAIVALVVVIFTFVWFVPKIMILGAGGEGLSAAEITNLTNWWVGLNWVRVVLFSSAWLAALRAMTIPSSARTD